MDFFFFFLVTAILFIRPTDFIPELQSVPLYLIALFFCVVLSWHKLIPFFSSAAWRDLPVLVFGVGVLIVALTTSFVHGKIAEILTPATEFTKVLFFFLLMQAQLSSRARLKLYVALVAVVIAFPVSLAVLDYHEYINVEAFKQTKELGEAQEEVQEATVKRLGTTGNFADPNDVCEIVNFAIIFSLCGLFDRGGGFLRVLWLAPLALFGHALILTQSRGGLLGFLAGCGMLFRSRFGTRKTVMAAALALPVMAAVFASRQTSIDIQGGTGQERIQLWDDAFIMIRGNPLLGGGWGEFIKSSRHAAHNALIQICADMGVLGGLFLVGQYYYCLKNMNDLNPAKVALPDPEMRRLQPYVLASMASFAVSEMTITNPFSLVTYVVFGISTAFIRMAHPRPPLADLSLSWSLARRATLFCVAILAVLFAFVRFNVRYGH